MAGGKIGGITPPAVHNTPPLFLGPDGAAPKRRADLVEKSLSELIAVTELPWIEFGDCHRPLGLLLQRLDNHILNRRLPCTPRAMDRDDDAVTSSPATDRLGDCLGKGTPGEFVFR